MVTKIFRPSYQNTKQFFSLVLIWTLINVIFNGVCYWLGQVLSEYELSLPDFLFELKIFLAQSALFGVSLLTGWMFIKLEKLRPYTFVIINTLVFHFILLTNLENIDGVIHFSSSDDNLGYQYLMVCSSHISDIAFVYLPMYGGFSEGMVIPDSLSIFYFNSILVLIIYYLVITWITVLTSKHVNLIGQKVCESSS